MRSVSDLNPIWILHIKILQRLSPNHTWSLQDLELTWEDYRVASNGTRLINGREKGVRAEKTRHAELVRSHGATRCFMRWPRDPKTEHYFPLPSGLLSFFLSPSISVCWVGCCAVAGRNTSTTRETRRLILSHTRSVRHGDMRDHELLPPCVGNLVFLSAEASLLRLHKKSCSYIKGS